jgi:hypothetical protein
VSIGRVVGLTVALLIAAATVAAAAGARDADVAAKCGNPARESLGSIYGKNRGTTWCNDGASGTATLAGKTYAFKGGVCFRDSVGFHVGIGTIIPGGWKKGDPAGLGIDDLKPGGYAKDGAYFGWTRGGKLSTWDWGDVKIKGSKGASPRGTFSGVRPTLVGGKLTRIPARGTFTCKRVLKVPL